MSRKQRRIYVSEARSRSGSVELEELFDRYGNINSFDVYDGKGYVEYDQEDSAKLAIKKLNNYKFSCQLINVEYASKPANKYAGKDKIDYFKKTGRCFKCHEHGHIQKDCPLDQQNSDSQNSYSKSPSKHKKEKYRKKSSSRYRKQRKRRSRTRSRSKNRNSKKSRSRSKQRNDKRHLRRSRSKS